jgi:4'-phosphopantetheinyl transferase
MRSALRDVLGRYLHVPPDSITFAYGEKGKPGLLKDQNSLDLRFNVSHSGNLGILAVTSGFEVGVDVETRQKVVDYISVAQRFFSRREYEALSNVPEDLRQRAFLRCWTRKESYVKALGQGLACSLKSFSVSVSPHLSDNCLLESVSALKHDVSDVDLPDDCFSCVAVERESRPRFCWTYCD